MHKNSGAPVFVMSGLGHLEVSDFMWLWAWAIFGEICVVLVAFGFVKHVYYVIKNVWLVKRALDKPQRVLPRPGPVTLNGIVSSIGDETPVRVTIVDHGDRGAKRRPDGQRMSYKVEGHPFALLLPEVGARIIVEPGEHVRLRAASSAMSLEDDEEVGEIRGVCTATLEDGDHAIVSGILSESREVELVANQYRSQKENVRIEYVLKPGSNGEIKIDSETLIHELQSLFSPLAWVRGIGTLLLVSTYKVSLEEAFSTRTNIMFGLLLLLFLYFRLIFAYMDRRPWFDRFTDPKKPYRGADELKRSELP